MPQYLEIRQGMRLERRPGALVLSYQDERVPTGEPMVVTFVSENGRTATFWLENLERTETVFLHEVVTPDFVVVDERAPELNEYRTLAALYHHGTRITATPGMRFMRTGRPFSTLDRGVPYNTVVTITEVVYEEATAEEPGQDYLVFESPMGKGTIKGYEMTDAYFEEVK